MICNVLILGSGGREHALAWKISQSPFLGKLFVSPGNAGTGQTGENIGLSPTDFKGIGNFVLDRKIGMVVVGPEVPLVEGIHDYFLGNYRLKDVPVIGPLKSGAMLEGSKKFANDFMSEHGIPTAGYLTVNEDNMDEGIDFLKKQESPYVLKANGLAAGKGVLILDKYEEAERSLREMLGGKFGKASECVVIEEYLSGIEVSVFVLTDGKSYMILPSAKDYKRIGEGDTGLNTGGMGAVSPVPFTDDLFMKKVEEKIVKPTINGLRSSGIEYKGFLYLGLMNVLGNPYVVEYNVRMGDPEAEVIVPRIQSDLLELFVAVANGDLDRQTLETDPRASSTVMLVSKGYPGKYEKGKEIRNLDKAEEALLFHAGTRQEGDRVLTNGGRVIAVSAYGDTIRSALAHSYRVANIVDFEGKHYRKDIGFDLSE